MRIHLALVAVLLSVTGAFPGASSRLELIRQRGFLTCGVEISVPGFAEIDAQGRYRGFDVDICRALAAAILGTPDKIKFVALSSVAEFTRTDEVDVVSRRLTWELTREAPLGLLFGPITFYDGQGFLVSKQLKAKTLRHLAGAELCVAGGTHFEFNVTSYFAQRKLELKKLVLESGTIPVAVEALRQGRCRAYTADVSELAAIRSRLPRPGDFDILADRISREPLAPLVRDNDPQFFSVVRWTVFALINAEELGVTSRNIDTMRQSPEGEIQRLLGVVPGNGKALGLGEAWAYDAIKAVGNYGEMFERNIGRSSPLGLDRGLNRLSTAGGLMYAPPLR